MTLSTIAALVLPVLGAWVLARMLRTGRLPPHSAAAEGIVARYHWSIPLLGWSLFVPAVLSLVFWPSAKGDDPLMAAVGILLMLLTGGWFVLDGHFYYLKVTKLGLDEFRPLRGRRVVPWTSIRTTSFDKLSKYLTLHTIASGSIRISPVVRGFTTVVDYIVANTPASVHQPGVQALQKDPNQWLSQ